MHSMVDGLRDYGMETSFYGDRGICSAITEPKAEGGNRTVSESLIDLREVRSGMPITQRDVVGVYTLDVI